MYSTSDFRNGLKILVDNTPYEIVYFQHVKPGKGGAFVRTKLRNLFNRSVVEKTFRASEKVGVPDVADVEMQFLYADDSFHFMNTETYDQLALTEEVVGEAAKYLKESSNITARIYNGKVIGVELPQFMELVVSRCDPGLRGDTVSGATKPATLETGATVQVPLFINEGDKLKVDTRTGSYIERVS